MAKIINKLHPKCQDVLSGAFGLARKNGNFFVEIQHFLFKGFVDQLPDFHFVLRHYDIDISSVLKQINMSIDKMNKNSQMSPAYSPHLLMLFDQAWYISSVELDLHYISGVSMMFVLVDYDPLRGIMLEHCPLFLRIPRTVFKNEIEELLQSLCESQKKMVIC
jgi:type VI secretion system protein VasG